MPENLSSYLRDTTLATGTALAGGDGRFCSATTTAQFKACTNEVKDDFFVAKAKCINVSNGDERAKCFDTARGERVQSNQLCRAQRAQRLEICGELGEARYDPDFDPANFDSDYRHLTNPNPYFPFTIGYRWDYAGSLETNTISSRSTRPSSSRA